jgi:hypothetical protein
MKDGSKESAHQSHFGFTGQNVAETLEKHGIENFAGLQKAEEGLMLNYTQFIAPLCKAVQELDAERARNVETIDALQKAFINMQEELRELRDKYVQPQP